MADKAKLNKGDVVYRFEKVFSESCDAVDIRIKRSVVTGVVPPTVHGHLYAYRVHDSDGEYVEKDLWVDMAEMTAYLLKDQKSRLKGQDWLIDEAQAKVTNMKRQKDNIENIIKTLNKYV